MTSFPVGKNHDSWPRLANHPRNFKAVLPRVLDVPVRDVKRMPPARAQDLRRVGCFTRSVFGCAAGTHLSPWEVKNPGAWARRAIFSSVPPHVCSTSSRCAAIARTSREEEVVISPLTHRVARPSFLSFDQKPCQFL